MTLAWEEVLINEVHFQEQYVTKAKGWLLINPCMIYGTQTLNSIEKRHFKVESSTGETQDVRHIFRG